MKNLYLLILGLILPLHAIAQFQLTPDGMRTTDGKSYIVSTIKGSQKQLYQKTKTVLTSMLKTKDYEMKSNEPDIIIISCKGLKIAKEYVAGLKDSYKTNWTIEIKFKPNKIRIDAPLIEPLKCRHSIISLEKGNAIGVSSGLNRKGHLFKDDGSVREDHMVEQINEYFNGLVDDIISNVKNFDSTDNNW